MRIKELKRTVNVAWSPADTYPVLLAAGTAAQQLDASFSSNSSLDLYSLNLQDPGLDLELKCSLQTKNKFQKLVWSSAGIIVGGCDGGTLQFYGVSKLLENQASAYLGDTTKHTGNVSALDVNPFQKNLIASGASDSEILIWDLNNTTQPMAPGNRSQPFDHVQGLAWNQQVQHILGSTFSNRCVVWDLRKNEPIMKLSDSQLRTRWRSMCWHPAVATQLCVGSEDDLTPVVQIWDLRMAGSPLVNMEGHRGGVLDVSWSPHDSGLLLSAGKDGAIYCWNPNHTQPGGVMECEISRSSSWVTSVAWSPRVPGVLVASSTDDRTRVHTIMPTGDQQCTDGVSSLAESFGAACTASDTPLSQPPLCTGPHTAPHWIRRPTRAHFGFGGKLVSFEKCPKEAGVPKTVYISQVVTDPECVQEAETLSPVLSAHLQDPNSANVLAQYCLERGESCPDQSERLVWFILRAHFLHDCRGEILNLLGYKSEDPSRDKSFAPGDLPPSDTGEFNNHVLARGESTETEAELSTDTSTDLSGAHTLVERKLSNVDHVPSVKNVTIPNGEDSTSQICRALICGNLEEAVELCLEAKRISDALVIASMGESSLMSRVQKYYLNSVIDSPVGLLAGGLSGRWRYLVEGAEGRSWRGVLGALLTHADDHTMRHYASELGTAVVDSSLEGACASWTVGGAGGRVVSSLPHSRTLPPLALTLHKAHQYMGLNTQSDGKIEAVLEEFAMKLCSQGEMERALMILDQLPDSPLADRLRRASGHVQYNQQPRVQTVAPSATSRVRHPSGPRRSLPHHDNNTTYNPASLAVDPTPAYSQPPRPPSTGSGQSHGRPKYVVDPSVAAAPLYGHYSFPPAPPAPSTPAVSSPYVSAPLPDHYSAASVPSRPPGNQNTTHAANPAFNTMNQPLNHMNPPLNPMNPPLNPMNSPLNPMNPPLNHMNPPLNHMNPPLNHMNPTLNPMNPMNPVNPMQPMNPAPPSMNGQYESVARSCAPGWNDPPMVTSKPKPKPEVHQPAPITTPLLVPEPQHIPLQPPQGQMGNMGPMGNMGQMGQAGQMGQMNQMGQMPGYNMSQQHQPAQGYPPQTMSPLPPCAPPVPPRPPLPAEWAPLETALTRLRDHCLRNAHNQQMKRKLEDVQKKLENLYDLLREYRLSEATLSTLQSCRSLVESGEYESALLHVSSLAVGGDFAAVASFLPALKTLLQLASHAQYAT